MTLDPDTLTWTCMVCHDTRPDEMIQVAYRPMPGFIGTRPAADDFPGTRINVRYCKDRPACTEQAIASGPWLGSNK